MYLALLLRPGLSSRFARKAARRWRRVRGRWQGVDKEPWILALVIGLVIAILGFMLWGVTAHQDQTRELARHEERRNLTCLAWNVYFEARGEPLAGQYAVAEVTMNRRASGRFSDTVCGVVYQQNWDPLRKRYVGAFSWTERQALPLPAGEEWERAWKVAESVYFMREPPKLHGVMYFHSVHIKPEWAAGRKPVARIGRHVFYK
jgi:spore germination cell wall hydrolase CwlJ-like protein